MILESQKSRILFWEVICPLIPSVSRRRDRKIPYDDCKLNNLPILFQWISYLLRFLKKKVEWSTHGAHVLLYQIQRCRASSIPRWFNFKNLTYFDTKTKHDKVWCRKWLCFIYNFLKNSGKSLLHQHTKSSFVFSVTDHRKFDFKNHR